MVDLPELKDPPSSEGGITVIYQGPDGGLQANGGLQDSGNGYSASLRFLAASSPSIKPPAEGYAELGLMIGAADPMMSFPAGTVFTPYSLVRNTTAQPIAITPVLWWMEAGIARSARLPQVALAARSTTSLPVNSFLIQAGLKNFNGNFNLILEANARVGELLMDSGSVDQSNTYVFEVGPQALGESMSKSLSYWSTGKGDDTMITVWNPADEAQDFVFTLFFSGGSYKYSVPLGPRATRNFNISDIVMSQIPDADGNTIPMGIHEGSALISGSQAEHERILVAITIGTYNVRKATCGGPGCTKCTTSDGGELQLDPFAVAVNGTAAEKLTVVTSSGAVVDSSASATWKSSDTGVATVSSGTVTGVAAGTFTLSATSTQDWPLPGFSCPPSPCPVGPVSGGGSGTALSAIVTLNSSGQVSATDGASTLYKGVVGSLNLGIMAGQLGVNNACFGGNELVGTVTPSTSVGPVTVKRTLTSGGCYKGSTAQACPVANGADDTGTLITTNPQNVTAGGSANGHVYNLDNPGVTDPLATTPIRVRYDFTAYAVGPDGVTQISPNLSYYVVLSCINGSSGVAQLSTGISGDNQIGLGTTKTSWNLQ